MDRIGVRELRQNASVYLERVKKGESIEVTERGVPVAMLTPVKGASEYDRMVADGTITPAQGDIREWLRRPPAPPAAPGEKTLSQALQEMRDEEYER